MNFHIVPRITYGLPSQVVDTQGRPRPQLLGATYYTFHYTGVSVRYAERSTPSEILKIQSTFGSTKPFMYNYVIGQEPDTKVYEFAGVFQGAHSAGNNGNSFGVLFLNGTTERLTGLQIQKAQWLRDVLRHSGRLRAQPDQRPHQLMPGAKTACPGDLIMRDLSKLVGDYLPSEYRPNQNQWSYWPLGNKPYLRLNDTGAAVLYLNDVMREKAAQGTCGDVYNASTKRGVRNIQNLFRITDEQDMVGPKTWAAIDHLALMS
jgi:hypothetical protein